MLNKVNKKGYSQYKQDLLIDICLSHKKDGFFLDIGANDGITFSNTYLFERYRNWNGICVEPQIDMFEKLKEIRHSYIENCCISKENGVVTFRKVFGCANMLSGILEFMDEDASERIEKEVEKYGGSYEDILVKSININDLLDKYKIDKIDFCSIDVEGGEWAIIQDLNFDKFDITVFAIEGDNEQINSYLKAKGYRMFISENDNFFVKKNYHNIWLFSLCVKCYKLSWKIWRRLPSWMRWKR